MGGTSGWAIFLETARKQIPRISTWDLRGSRIVLRGSGMGQKIPIEPIIQGSPTKLRPALGEGRAARDPVWDGEGWGCDRIACPVISCYRSWALAVATAGRPSPSETQTLGSRCD